MFLEKLKEIMTNVLGCDEDKITMDASIAEDLGIDSLDAVELVMSIEENLGIKIPDEELGNMKYVKDIVACLEKYQD